MWRLLPLLLALTFPADAFAWRQSMTCLLDEPPAPTATPYCEGRQFPKPLSWPTPTVRFRVNEAGTDQFPTDDGMIHPDLLEAIQVSFEQWNEPECSNFEFVYDGLTEADAFDREDGINLVVFQDEDWPHGDMALAISTITANNDAEIINADMELNSASQQFALVEPGGSEWDVRNTVTHEAGHFVGLDHDAVADSTMEFEASRGETKKRDLHPDDIDGLCSIYPSGEPLDEPMDKDPPDDDGCCATTAPQPTSPLALALLLAAAAARRRQR